MCHGGANDVCKHFGTVKHTSLVSSRQTTRFLSDFGFGSGIAARASRISAEEMNLKVQQAESLMCILFLSTICLFELMTTFSPVLHKMVTSWPLVSVE